VPAAQLAAGPLVLLCRVERRPLGVVVTQGNLIRRRMRSTVFVTAAALSWGCVRINQRQAGQAVPPGEGPMTRCNGRPTKTPTATERDRAALAKVLADVEDLAGDAALLFDLHADRIGADRLAVLLTGARAARKRLARLVDELPADPAPMPAWRRRGLQRHPDHQGQGGAPAQGVPGQDGEAVGTAPDTGA
jgi:hypothetical protein